MWRHMKSCMTYISRSIILVISNLSSACSHTWRFQNLTCIKLSLWTNYIICSMFLICLPWFLLQGISHWKSNDHWWYQTLTHLKIYFFLNVWERENATWMVYLLLEGFKDSPWVQYNIFQKFMDTLKQHLIGWHLTCPISVRSSSLSNLSQFMLCKNGKSSECFLMGFSQVSQHPADYILTFEAKEAHLLRDFFWLLLTKCWLNLFIKLLHDFIWYVLDICMTPLDFLFLQRVTCNALTNMVTVTSHWCCPG